MSTLQWQFGGVHVSFDNEVPVPSYISFEKEAQPNPLLYNSEDDSEEEGGGGLEGGATLNWENIHHRYRVVASAEITENVTINEQDVPFGNEPRNGDWGLENMPLPRQVVLEMLRNHPEAQGVMSSNNWKDVVREVGTKQRGFETPLECVFSGPGEQKWVVRRMRDIGKMNAQQRAKLVSSPGRIRTNMFWLAQRQWEFIQNVIQLDIPQVNQLLRDEVLQVLTTPNLPPKAKDLLPEHYSVLYTQSWLAAAAAAAQEEEEASSQEGSPRFSPGGLPGFSPGGSEEESSRFSPGGSEEESSRFSPGGPPPSSPPPPSRSVRRSGFMSGLLPRPGPEPEPVAVAVAAVPAEESPGGSPGPPRPLRRSGVAALVPAVPAEESPGGSPGPPRPLRRSGVAALVPAVPAEEESPGGSPGPPRPLRRSGVAAPVAAAFHVGYGSPRLLGSVGGPSSAAVQQAQQVQQVQPPPVILGGDHLSSETGLYGGVQRWVGNFKEQDQFQVAPGFEDYMNTLYNTEKAKLESIPNSNFMVQKITSFYNNGQLEMLYTLLYLITNNLFIASKEELVTNNLLDANFDEMDLFNVCKESLIELKPNELYEKRLSSPTSSARLLQKETRNALFSLEYQNHKDPKNGSYVTKLYLIESKNRNMKDFVNYLPVLLYQMCKDNLHENLEFVFTALSPTQKQMVQNLYGNSRFTTKTKLKMHLQQLQEDLGFYKLNKGQNEYVSNLSQKTTMIVFSLERKDSNSIQVEDIETWITGYVIPRGNNLPFSIRKRRSDIQQYPWIYTATSETSFDPHAHLKIELICRRKLYAEIQGIGLSTMLYFISYFQTYYEGLNMVLIDVSRTEDNIGLPDPMFSQVLHERLKFQRTFELQDMFNSLAVRDLYNPQDYNLCKEMLSQSFDVERHAPYVKLFRQNLSNQFIQSEFYNLPQNFDIRDWDDDLQPILQQCAKTLTMARPMFTKQDISSIIQRLIQSIVENDTNVQRGALESY